MSKGREPNLYKWNFAIGTTSRVPYFYNRHYLIADVDGRIQPVIKNLFSKLTPDHIFIQTTQNGYHIYTDYQLNFTDLVLLLHKIGADKTWIEIGQKRGYFFLADKAQIIFPWPVERMILHAKKR